MYPKRWCQAATFACILLILITALALLAGPADAQETPCPWPTSWVPAYATEVAGTHRQTLIMRPVCAPATPAPAVEAVPAPETNVTADVGFFGLPLWYERMAGVIAIVGAVLLDILRRRALAHRNRPRTLGEQMGVYERGGGGGE